MFAVYKASGYKSEESYYGYTKVDNDDDIPGQFFKIAKNTPDLKSPTGAAKLFLLNDEDEEMITFDLVDVFDNEIEAWTARNDIRASARGESITGPTFMPWGLAERVQAETPEKLTYWKKSIKLREAKTARVAWGMGKWTNDEIICLIKRFNKKEIILDLDILTPIAFNKKYFT